MAKRLVDAIWDITPDLARQQTAIFRTGTVTAVAASTVDVNLDGVIQPGIRTLKRYTPIVGDQVLLIGMGGAWYALDALA